MKLRIAELRIERPMPISRNNRSHQLTMLYQSRPTTHHPDMKTVMWLPSSCALILILTGCADKNTTAANDPGTGPFDRNGNYVEAWANDPSKWRKPGSRSQSLPGDDPPVIAKNDQPPPNANPLGPQVAANPKPAPVRVASVPRETARPKAEVKNTATTPKPKPMVVKAKPKPKPKPTRYLVKKGDTLSAIASRNGSSVSAIQRANGISGSLIRPGQSLVIPKR